MRMFGSHSSGAGMCFRKSPSVVRAIRRRTIFLLPLYANYGPTACQNKRDHGQGCAEQTEAWNLWDKIWADHRIAFLPEPDGLERKFREPSRLPSHSPKVWADAYLLAFASVTGAKLVTFDRALESRGADVLVL